MCRVNTVEYGNILDLQFIFSDGRFIKSIYLIGGLNFSAVSPYLSFQPFQKR